MTQSPIGGPATPTKTTSDAARVKAGPALRAFVVTDGRSVEGGPSLPIYRVSDGEIAAGQFVVAGNRPIPIYEQGEASGDLAQPVYIVDANSPGDDPLPDLTLPPAGDPIGDILRADAVAYWTMDESSGTRLDATNRGNNAVEVGGAVASITGKIGNAADFNFDAARYLSVANSDDVQMASTDFTIAGWFYLKAGNSLTRYFISKGATDVVDYELGYFEFGVREFGFFCGGDAVYADDFFYPDPGWYFIVGDYNHNTQTPTIAINNGIKNNYGPIGAAAVTNGPLLIASDNLGNTIGGSIDEVLLIKRLLTQDERDYLYNSGAGRTLFP